MMFHAFFNIPPPEKPPCPPVAYRFTHSTDEEPPREVLNSAPLQGPLDFRYACTLTEYFKNVQERQESGAKEVEAMREEEDTE